jgi:tetratricopeptide (TPR) repeat protein
VELESAGDQRTIPTDSIKQILFGDEPSALRSARDSILDGRWDQALQSLERIETDELDDPWIRQDFLFYRAYAQGKTAMQTGVGDAEAVRALLAFAADHRDSWHIYQTAELLGDLALKLGKLDRALQFYRQLNNAKSAETRLRGALLEAESLRQQGPDQYPRAIERYDVALGIDSAAPTAARLKQLATIGKARCNAVVGDPQTSIQVLERIIEENDASDGELFARAYVALGACYLRMESPEDAVLALLKVDLLFHEDSDAHAEALYHLSKLWPLLGKPDRAADARSRLQARYAGSGWAQRP